MIERHYPSCQTTQPGDAPLTCNCGADEVADLQDDLKAVIRAYRELLLKYDNLEERCQK